MRLPCRIYIFPICEYVTWEDTNITPTLQNGLKFFFSFLSHEKRESQNEFNSTLFLLDRSCCVTGSKFRIVLLHNYYKKVKALCVCEMGREERTLFSSFYHRVSTHATEWNNSWTLFSFHPTIIIHPQFFLFSVLLFLAQFWFYPGNQRGNLEKR